MEQPYFSIIMPSFLGEYEGAATGRHDKFIRAVTSFKDQIFSDCELIIVSDGCPDTVRLCEEAGYLLDDRITLIQLPKQDTFSGTVREAGLRVAKGKYIGYLDADDMIGNNHLYIIYNELKRFKEPNFAYYEGLIWSGSPIIPSGLWKTKLKKGSLGSFAIIHKNLPEITWHGCDGYNHDHMFYEKNLRKFTDYKIKRPEYYICHVPSLNIDR